MKCNLLISRPVSSLYFSYQLLHNQKLQRPLAVQAARPTLVIPLYSPAKKLLINIAILRPLPLEISSIAWNFKEIVASAETGDVTGCLTGNKSPALERSWEKQPILAIAVVKRNVFLRQKPCIFSTCCYIVTNIDEVHILVTLIQSWLQYFNISQVIKRVSDVDQTEIPFG